MLARSAALGALVTLGCRSAPPAGPPPRLTLWGQPFSVAGAQALFVTQTDDAGKEAGVSVTYQTSSPNDQRTQLRTAEASGQLPDVAIVASVDTPRLVARGLVRDVRASFERIAGVNGDLFPPLLGLATAGPWNDLPSYPKPPIWAIPHLSSGGAWLVRRDLLENKTIPPPSSFADFQSSVEQLTAGANGGFGWGAALPLDDGVDDLTQVVLLDHGAALFEGNGVRVALTPADAEAGFKAIARLYRSDSGLALAPSDAMDWSPNDAATTFARGTVAQTIDYGGLYAAIVEAAPTLRDVILALPPPQGPKGRFTAASTTMFVVGSRSRVGDRAVDFLERLLGPVRFEAIVRAGAGSIVPPYAYLTKGPFWEDDPNYQVFAANARGDPARNFQYATPGSPAPLTLSVANVRGKQILAGLLRRVVKGDLTPAAAATALNEQSQLAAREGYALQPAPTATPSPTWWRVLTTLQQIVSPDTPTAANGS